MGLLIIDGVLDHCHHCQTMRKQLGIWLNRHCSVKLTTKVLMTCGRDNINVIICINGISVIIRIPWGRPKGIDDLFNHHWIINDQPLTTESGEKTFCSQPGIDTAGTTLLLISMYRIQFYEYHLCEHFESVLHSVTLHNYLHIHTWNIRELYININMDHLESYRHKMLSTMIT